MKKRLRSGYTTGACAAAAAKAAASLLLNGSVENNSEIPLIDGRRVSFAIHSRNAADGSARVSVIKDAGDDPDVTNKAEIGAIARLVPRGKGEKEVWVRIKGGKGVGTVTKPGLAVEVGSSAINPVPRKMIAQAVGEVAGLKNIESQKLLEITIFVPKGEELAEKTLNKRLGIIGGISILGTTGIVRPLSAEAWTATIQASINVAVCRRVKGNNTVYGENIRKSGKRHSRSS